MDQKKWTACELNMSVTAKGLNTYDHVIFQFLFFNTFARWVVECTLMREKNELVRF